MTTPSQTPLNGEQKHLNQGLFSDYYLNKIVPTFDLWQSDDLHLKMAGIRDELNALLESLHPQALDEAQLEELWVKPVLEKLGHHWSVQVKIRYRDRGYRKPDYVFTETQDAARALTNQIYNSAQLVQTLAVGDAKKWGVNLDRASASEERNPSQQIDEYLRYSELSWGILTDGRYWRLYERETSKNNDYYAVDLPALLRSDDVEDFYYFYLFFRREAFGKGEWLDQVLQGSITYAEQISDELEDQVYEALELIAQGFLDYRRNRLSPDSSTLATIYEQSLVLLYRLLFILYAESRQVLPMLDNDLYRKQRSLETIRKDAQLELDTYPARVRLAVDRTDFYSRLDDLFFMIDQGDTQYNVSAYNGRLFSGAEYPFLHQNKVGDANLIQAIDMLSRVYDAEKRQRVMVDYRDLDVRHLGAIYEKLLEYQLDLTTEPLTVKEGKYVRAGEGDKDVVKQPNEVYLKTGNNERKITGSYYTPDYIVNFIVRQTLEPLLLEIAHQYATLDDEGHWQMRDPEGLRRAVLNLNVLDPATGSGHFMVEAVAFIARWLTELNLQPADIEAGEDELTYWKRQVVNSCIYGIDVNRLAVELARLSLWLATVARGKPLSFLDHHVKHGNALVGARASEIGAQLNGVAEAADGQIPLFDQAAFNATLSDAVGKMSDIEHTIAAAVGDVKEQEQAYALLDAELARWRTLANVWTARHFGLNLTNDQWTALYNAIVGAKDGANLPAALQAIVDEAERLSKQYRFLHPDLAFPEVFFGADGKPRTDAGFDAVIGNPPYVRQERIQPLKPYLATKYAIHDDTADLFLYFFERSLHLVKPLRRVGFISTSSFTNSDSAFAFRSYINKTATFETVIDFGAVQPFKGVDLDSSAMISVLKNTNRHETFAAVVLQGRKAPTSLFDELNRNGFVCAPNLTSRNYWRFQPATLTELYQRVETSFPPFKDKYGEIRSGIKPGRSKVFIIDSERADALIREHQNSRELLKPVLIGEDLRSWYQYDSSRYIILTRTGTQLENYPAIERYLRGYRASLSTRDEVKSGQSKWFELRPCSYYDEFEGKKIVWSDTAPSPRFSLDDGHYMNNTAFMFSSDQMSLLGLLQSRFTWFCLSQVATPRNIRAGFWRYRTLPEFVQLIPIPQLTANQESRLAELAEQITGLARSRYHLHEVTRHRIADLGEGGKLNNALEAWWALDFGEFRAQVTRVFKRDVPLRERDEWEGYLADETAQHHELTAQIVTLETTLNAVVYQAFKLTPEEIALIEQATKYPYGTV